MRHPRLVFVVASLRRGGAERQLIGLAEAIRERGWEVAILCLERTHNDAWRDRMLAAGVEIEELDLARFSGRGKRLRQLGRMVHAYRFLRRASPDVVYCFMWWSYILLVPIAALARVPVIATCRQSLSDTEGARRVLRPLHVLADRLADVVVCVSEAARRDAIDNVRTPPSKIEVVPNAVQVPAEPADPPSSGQLRILTIANLHPYKGHTVLLDAFANVRERLGAGRVRLELAGDGVERDRLERRAAELGIEHDVSFLGTVEDVEGRLREAAFTVLPSISEGHPLSVMESMAHARPVVATETGGTPEILARGGGVLVPVGNATMLADAIVRLASDADLRAALGRRAHQIALEEHSIERVADRTIALFEAVARRKGHALASCRAF